MDRVLNRFLDYPALLRRQVGEFDLFHVVDHTYGQLVHHLPASKTVVTCHDLHTFESVLEPGGRRRSAAFRWMTRRILRGVTRAAHVVVDTSAIRDQLLAHGVVPEERITVAPLGVHPEFREPATDWAEAEADRLLGPDRSRVDLLHVGQPYGRKRIDLLLRIFSRIRAERPEARLVRIGGAFSTEQLRLMRELGLEADVLDLRFVDRRVLAAIYRRAALLVLPSETEGFGLPVIEAMTCGTPVVATDLAVLREVGGAAAEFCPLGDLDAWTSRIRSLLDEQASDPGAWADRRDRGRRQAEAFSWSAYARKMADVYSTVAGR